MSVSSRGTWGPRWPSWDHSTAPESQGGLTAPTDSKSLPPLAALLLHLPGPTVSPRSFPRTLHSAYSFWLSSKCSSLPPEFPFGVMAVPQSCFCGGAEVSFPRRNCGVRDQRFGVVGVVKGCTVCLLMLTLPVSSPLPAPARKLPPKRAEGDIKPYSSSDRECKTGVGGLGLGVT